MKIQSIFVCILLVSVFATDLNCFSQISKMNFDPKRDGFGFKNYRNESDRWKNDLGADDLVRMFGKSTSCDSLDERRNCKVLRTSAEQWRQEMLEAMNIGHCEGMAVATLRMRAGLPFKSTQPGSQSIFGLGRNEFLENYIAYYWVTQTFDEVKRLTAATAKAGPAEIARSIAKSIETGNDAYVLRFAKFNPKTNRITEPHAVVPYAVEELPNSFVLSVYDNNFPGQERKLRIAKDESERWEYSSKSDPKAKPDYIGDRSTETLSITANSWREGKCFASKWRTGVERSGCEIAGSDRPFSMINAAFQQPTETAEFFLTDEGDLLVTDPNGDRIGYDPSEDYFFNDIDGALVSSLVGGFFEDVPHYTVPYVESDEFVYSLLFSGRYIDSESNLDFVYAAPHFTVGLSGIRLDPRETLEALVSTNGEQITFIASADTETPEVFFAFDAEPEDEASYFAYVEGVAISAGKRLTLDFDFDEGKLFFSDDDGNRDAYDIMLIRVNPDGTSQVYEQNDLKIGDADRYSMDFGDWDGEGEMCFKEDDEGNGFADEECVEEENEEP